MQRRRARLMLVRDYVEAVASMHGMSYRAMARALRVNPTQVYRWRRGRARPSWERIRAMTALWGGDPRILYLASVLEDFARTAGGTVEEACRLPFEAATGPRPTRRASTRADRKQLALPLARR